MENDKEKIIEFKINKEKLEDVYESLKELELRFDEVIVGLYGRDDMVNIRHSTMYYRSLLWNIVKTLENNTKQIK